MSMPTYIHHSGWPWPLDAVQNWFESLWDYITSTANWIVEKVWEWMPDWIRKAITYLSDIMTQVGWTLIDFFKDPVGTLKKGFDWVLTGLTDLVGWWDPKQERFVGGFLGWLWDTFEGVATWISDAASWIYENVTTLISNLSAAVTGAITLVADTLSEGLEWLLTKAKESIDGALTWASETFTWLAERVNTGLEWAVDRVGTMFDGASTILGDVIGSVFSGPLGAITEFFGGVLGSLSMGRLGELAGGMTPILDGIHATYTRTLAAHSPLTPEEAYSETLTWRSEQRDHWFELFFFGFGVELATLGQCEAPLTMMFQEPQIKASLALATEWYAAPYTYGYSELVKQFWYKAYTPLLPPVVDLIRFVVREVITPERFYELMPYLGFSREIAEHYWEAHFVLPPITLLYDAFHRGAITSEELDKYVFWHDYKPEPRPGIKKSDIEIVRSTIKTLIPRVDLRYGWEMGRLTDEELLGRYEYLGYEDDSELMADIQKLRAMTEEIHKIRDEWLRYFIEGHILEDTLRANLGAIGIGPTRIEYYVEYAKKRREREYLSDLLDYYLDAYLKDLIAEEEFEDRVYELIVDLDAATLFINRAYVRKYKKPSPPRDIEAEKAEKELYKYRVTYVRQLYRTYTIEKPEMITMWVEAGMDPNVARTRADYEELKRPIKKPPAEEIARAKEQLRIQTLEEKTLIEEFRRAVRTAEDLLTGLIEIGYSEALATAITQLEIIRALPKPGGAVAG